MCRAASRFEAFESKVRPVKCRPAIIVGLVHIAPLAEQPRHELRVGLSCADRRGPGAFEFPLAKLPALALALALPLQLLALDS